MDAGNVLFMTPEESERVQNTLKQLSQRCHDERGQQRQARDRKGEIQQAVSTSLMQDLSSSFGGGKSNDTMAAYITGRQYPPCLQDVSELEEMKLSELKLDTHHRGKRLNLRRVSPVVDLKSSSWTVVQADESDDVERLEVFLHKLRNDKDVLESGIEFVVKDPYFTLNNLGERTLRIDHPSDLVISAYADDLEEWRKAVSDPNKEEKEPEKCKQKGNSSLEKKDFARAHAWYTQGIAKAGANAGIRRDLHRNRSHVNLVLLRYDEARSDAVASLISGETDEEKSLDSKAYFRAGSAAYSLGDFEDAKSFFDEQLKLQPDNQNAKIFLRRIALRLKEKKHGTYDFNKAIASLAKTQRRPDLAIFDGHTDIKKSNGAGRGLFATRDIEPNEVIMCEKAFSVVWSWDRDVLTVLTCDMRDDGEIRVFPAGLHKAVVQKLAKNPSQIKKVLDLYGDYKGQGSNQRDSDGSSIIDSFQVHDVIQRNAFGPGPQSEDENISNASTGLWVRAAYMNHSCVMNAVKDFIGDVLVVRATKLIKAGEEITHNYDASSDVDDRAAMLQKTWGFKCKCALCVAERKDTPEVRKKRRDLDGQITEFLQRERASNAKIIAVTRAKRLRAAMDATFDEKRFKGLPRLALFGIDQWLEIAGRRK